MPFPLWDATRSLPPARIARGVAAYTLAKEHLPLRQALQFAGHVASHNPNPVLSVHAPESPDAFPFSGRRPYTPQERAEHYWAIAQATGHRYSKGKHALHHEQSGRRILAAAIRGHGPLVPDAENLLGQFEAGRDVHQILADLLQEHHPGAYELLVPKATEDNPTRALERYSRSYQESLKRSRS